MYPKKIPTGLCDKQLLCAPCDRGIGVWDQYAVELFLQELASFEPMSDSVEIVAFARPQFDYSRLKLFFLSVTSWPSDSRWRATPSLSVLASSRIPALGRSPNTVVNRSRLVAMRRSVNGQ